MVPDDNVWKSKECGSSSTPIDVESDTSCKYAQGDSLPPDPAGDAFCPGDSAELGYGEMSGLLAF